MTDWEEVKRLAADFQKVQLSSTTQKLSERNCIEIISMLIDRKMLDLIFTSDGKEYLTPSQLTSDIKGELYDHGGRINLVELAKIIGVDLAHINAQLNDLLKNNKDVQSVLGQLIDNSYIVRIAGEINEKLLQQGQVNISDLTIQYDLPADFLQNQVVERNLGRIIQAKQDKNDPKVFFTESFIARTKAKIKGALAGLTRPTPISYILNQINISEKLFYSLFDQTSAYGTLTGRMTGAQYIPNVYARSQNEWVNHFYKQNNYLEFDALSRLGVTDQKMYIKKQLVNQDYHVLNSCIVSKSILDRVEADIDECIASKTFVDLQNTIPSVFNRKDEEIILDLVLRAQKRFQTIQLKNYVFSKTFLDKLIKDCGSLIEEKCKTVVESGKYQQHQVDLLVGSGKPHKIEEVEEKVDKKEERRKKATGGKSGGGAQGRETKTKSTKKSARVAHRNSESDGDAPEKKVLEIVTFEDVKSVLQLLLEEEGLDEIVDDVVKYLLPKLNEDGLQMAADIFAVTVADRTATRRQTHNDIQNKLNAQIVDVRLFEKGLRLLPTDLQSQLVKYLLKTLCTDIVTEILNYISTEQNINTPTDNFNIDQRLKFVNDLPAEYKNPLTPVVKCLNGQSVDEFLTTIENALAACSMILKKIDKKKDRTTVLNHKHQLLEQLEQVDDLPLILHLAVVVIFTTATQTMLHCSGRHVSGVISFLKQYLTEEQFSELTSYYDFVTLMLSGGSEAENAKEKLKEKVPAIKKLANEYKKPGSEKS